MAATGFDEAPVYYSDSLGAPIISGDDELNLINVQKLFKDFIREFHDVNNIYHYRDELKRQYILRQYNLTVSLSDLSSFNELLADRVIKSPTTYLPLFETAAKEVADELTRPRPEEEEEVQDIHVLLNSPQSTVNIRDLKSDHMSRLVKVPGIIINASGVRAKATSLTLQCRSCRDYKSDIPIRPGLEGFAMPRKCTASTAGQQPCPLDPYYIVPDKCKCVDYQTLKLQEAPDHIPTGDMPRHIQLYVDRALVDKMVPGNRVQVVGIYSIKKMSDKGSKKDKITAGIRRPYIRVVGLEVDSTGPGRSLNKFTPEEEDDFKKLAERDEVYDLIARNIAPSIFGSEDIKKSIACLLFGGSRKRMPDGLTRRGDINLLLLGDPGTAKSQLLKFVEKCSPIGVYTSGKGSSAAGLTASVMRDPTTRCFVMEGGAMVLADGGVVCIDEFDKMREDDRVAIHEAMEQQTISIAKAGITTTLNTRCSVFAAANSVFGRWDDTKGEENIDFMPTILSRFDMIYIVKDDHNESRDTTIARHVMKIHLNREQAAVEGEMSIEMLKKYIAYARAKCGPRLSDKTAAKLGHKYVMMRTAAREHEHDSNKRLSIPITVRQLESIVRISESLAKMRLTAFTTDADVEESLRLFQVSTLESAMSGTLSGVEGLTALEDQEEVRKVERQLKQRFPIGSQVSEARIIQDFVKQRYSERSVKTVLHIMIRRGELQHRMQRKVVLRVK